MEKILSILRGHIRSLGGLLVENLLDQAAVYLRLVKLRLVLLVLVTCAAGFHMANPDPFLMGSFLTVLAGSTLLAGGVLTLNQWMEHEYDGRMARTAGRPIPAGDISRFKAGVFGCALVLAGLAVLLAARHDISLFLGILTAILYLAVYTPMKRWTPFCVYAGAVAGALPPLMGWAASGRPFGTGAWALAGILFFWQLVHFTAIAWLYREDYKQAGFVLFETHDKTGKSTFIKAQIYGLMTVLLSAVPYAVHLAGTAYLAASAVLGALLIYLDVQLFRRKGPAEARRLMLGSILYLFILLAILVIDRV